METDFDWMDVATLLDDIEEKNPPLSDWESAFVGGMLDKRGKLSEKQFVCLTKIHAKHCAAAEIGKGEQK
jgi:hypothetical protein